MTEKSWTFEKDVLLIQLVKSKPGLYDLQSPHYSDNSYKKKIWDVIERTVEQRGAKIRWESLRSQYRKYLAKFKTKSGQTGSKIGKWRYFDQMQFLNDHLTIDVPRMSSAVDEELVNENSRPENSDEEVTQASSPRQCNIIKEAKLVTDYIHPNNETASASESSSLSPKRKKMKRNMNPENTSTPYMKCFVENKESERPINPIDQFFALMATTVKTFSPLDQHAVKTRVFTLISQMEEKYLTSPRSVSPVPSSHSSPSPTFVEVSQRDCSKPSSHHIYIQPLPVNSKSYDVTDKHLKTPTRSTSHCDILLQSQRNTSPPLDENNFQLQYSSAKNHIKEEK